MGEVPADRPVLDQVSTGARRSTDHGRRAWADVRDVLLGALAAPLRPLARPTAVLGVAVLLAETVGLATRLTCRPDRCGPWARLLDMDALGSVPRALVTALLAAVAVCCLVAVVRAGLHGAAVWWLVLGLGAGVLAVAKQTSLHSVLEARLAGVLPSVDVQLGFVVVSAVGLLVVVVSGRWVRRGTRTAVTTWLGLYAAASVGLGAVSVVLADLGPVVTAVSTWVEETGEGLSAVGVLAVVVVEARAVGRRAR